MIASTSKIDLGMSEIQGLKVTMNKGTKFDIDYVIDIKTGGCESAEGEMILPLNMSGRNQQGEEVSVDMQIKSTIKLETK